MSALGAPGVHPEGQFFPDTYRFPYGTADVEVLRVAHDALATRLEDAWRNRSPDLLLKTDYEALILASIIEKETSLAAERKLIAGVFHERLRRNMRLQTDPTVIYGLGDAFDGNLRRAGSRARHAVQHLHARRPAADADRAARGRFDRSGGGTRRSAARSTSSRPAAATAAITSRRRSKSTSRPCATTCASFARGEP